MKRLFTILLAAGAVFAQTQVGTQVAFSANAPAGVTAVNVQRVGNFGNSTYYYWVIANYTIGSGSSGTPGMIIQSADTLSSTNYNQVFWTAIPGVLNYDVLRTTTPSIPAACNCAVVVGTNNTTVNDQSNSLSSYSYSPAPSVTATITLNNQSYSQPVLYGNTPYNTVFFAGLPSPASSKGLVFLISDSSSTTTCSGGGGTATPALCFSSGSAWIPLAAAISGGTTTVQVNGVNATTQNPINFQSANIFNGLTFTQTNPSSGNIKLGVTGTLGNAGLTNSSITFNTTSPLTGGATVALGGSITLACPSCGAGSGTVSSFSAGNLSPLFTTSVANATTTPALTFGLSNFAADNIFGNFTGSSAAPSTSLIPACANDGAHALVYVSHALVCASITGGGGGIGFNGTPTATAITTVFDSTHIQTPNAGTTLDGSGNFSTPGGLSTGVGGGAAGAWAFLQGTAPTLVANAATIYSGTSVTGYTFRMPSAAGTGFILGTNTSNDVVTTIVGSSGTGSVCLTVSCVMTTPNIGAATATSVNGTTIPSSVTLTQTIASGTIALTTSSITANSCASGQTSTATGAASTDVIFITPNADISAVTGYGAASTDGLKVSWWPTTNTANFKVCNGTGSSITPGAVTLNWRIVR